MKKMLSMFLLGGIILSATLTPALAENYRYRLYNPQTKRTTHVPMMTIGGRTNTEYRIAFLDGGNAPCVVDDSSINRNSQGLLGGQCLLLNRSGIVASWRELSAGNYYSELRSIDSERGEEGMHRIEFSIKSF